MWPCRLSSGRTCCTASRTPVEPTGPRISDLIGERVDLLPECVLGDLARCAPRCRAGLAEPDDLQVTRDVDHRAICIDAVLAGRERLVDVVRVIVAGDEDQRDAGALKPLG